LCRWNDSDNHFYKAIFLLGTLFSENQWLDLNFEQNFEQGEAHLDNPLCKIGKNFPLPKVIITVLTRSLKRLNGNDEQEKNFRRK